jgi:CheY-like chemotaxis protein
MTKTYPGEYKKPVRGLDTNNLQFLANVSHEIRNPLNGIIGIARLLKSVGSKEEREEYIDTLLKTSENLLELINNILDFSKYNSEKIEFNYKEVNLRELVRDIVNGQRVIAESKELRLLLEIDDSLPSIITIDPVKINQVLTNLVSNAIKFTSKGSVKVNLNVLQLKDDEVCVRCTVTDTGIGIPKEKLETIFDAFNQGDKEINTNYGGTGLGLTICRQIINSLGSDLQVKSSTEGSEFSFVLALETNKNLEGHSAEVEGISEKSIPKGIKVLVVDDNKVNVLVVQKHLELWGIDYDIANNGLNAVRKVQQQEFNLVLMDLHMPEMDGLEATEAIGHLMKSKGSILPIVGLTASTEVFYQGDIENAGFTDFLIKPFAPQELLNKIVLHSKILTAV